MKAESPVSADLWLRVATECDAATFFHTPYWTAIAAASDPQLQDATFSVRLPDNELAIYPLLRRKQPHRPLTSDLYSTFAGCYGGPIATRALSQQEHEALHLLARSRASGSISVTLGPLTSGHLVPRGYTGVSDTTHLLDLRPGWTEILRRFSKGRTSDYKRALREEVTVRRAVGDRDYMIYSDLYRKTVQRWGDRATSRYSESLFRKAFELTATVPEQVILSFAIHRAVPVAGMLGFAWRRHFLVWQVVTPQLQTISYSTALFAAAIRDAADAGYQIFDFSPSGGLPRVADYKKHFGAQEQAVLRLQSTSRRRLAVQVARTVRAAASQYRK